MVCVDACAPARATCTGSAACCCSPTAHCRSKAVRRLRCAPHHTAAWHPLVAKAPARPTHRPLPPPALTPAKGVGQIRTRQAQATAFPVGHDCIQRARTVSHPAGNTDVWPTPRLPRRRWSCGTCRPTTAWRRYRATSAPSPTCASRPTARCWPPAARWVRGPTAGEAGRRGRGCCWRLAHPLCMRLQCGLPGAPGGAERVRVRVRA